jgi:hypothetical protein
MKRLIIAAALISLPACETLPGTFNASIKGEIDGKEVTLTWQK